MNMKLIMGAAAVAAIAGCCSDSCCDKESTRCDKKAACCDKYADTVEEGFVSLFNGRDLTGWYGSKSYGVETIDMKRSTVR